MVIKIENYYVVHVTGDSLITERPKANNVYVIHWENAGVVIPWPEGMTIKEAVLAWAKENDIGG